MEQGEKIGKKRTLGLRKAIYYEKRINILANLSLYILMYITSDTQATAHHPSTNAQLTLQTADKGGMNTHPCKNSFHMMSCGMERPLVLILFPPSSQAFH